MNLRDLAGQVRWEGKLGEKLIGAQMGQGRIGDRPDVPELVLRFRRRAERSNHEDRVGRCAHHCQYGRRRAGCGVPQPSSRVRWTRFFALQFPYDRLFPPRALTDWGELARSLICAGCGTRP